MSAPRTDLGNFVWESLVGEHRHLAVGEKGARRYRADISPFAALHTPDPKSLQDLADIVSPDEIVLLRTEVPDLEGQWKLESRLQVVQMILPSSAPAERQEGLTLLSKKDVPQMLALTQLVLPGFFRAGGLEMGAFYGIFDGLKLVVMTGERVFPKPYREVTAVCTHPDYQGRGYAAKLVEHVSALMREAGHIPFLHTAESNSRALALYERLGFKTNAVVPLTGLRRL